MQLKNLKRKNNEYPVACIKNENTNEVIWKEQDNITMHLKNIKNADVTIGYHCGYISPIPYVGIRLYRRRNI